MKIELNGRQVEIQENTSISDLLEKYGLKDRPLVTELNGRVVNGSQHQAIRLSDGDVLEIVRLVGGG